MRYVSLTEEDRVLMLNKIGVRRIEDLFACIPPEFQFKGRLEIPQAASETAVIDHFKRLGKKNASTETHEYFLGAGAYHHFVPTVIDSIISRSEFYTAYTPYQPEISQGTLQAIFEFQTLVCQLTAMEVANASLYDGSSSLAEAVLMAARVTGRRKILVPRALHPAYRQVVETYVSNLDIELSEVPFAASGQLDLERAEEALADEPAALVVQSPNFLGVIEDLETLSGLAHRQGALSIAVITEAISLGLLRAPGDSGADIVVGEGQSWGIPMGFGGPYLGFFATREKFKRQLPGRLAGQTVDSRGRRGFVLTLATREQHIRREKATSNVCTNQGLCAVVAAVFLCTLGRRGIRQLAAQNLQKAHYLRTLLGDRVDFSGPLFNEMVVRCPEDPRAVNARLLDEGIVGGLPLARYYPDLEDRMLVCVTEQNRAAAIQRFAAVVNSMQVTA